MNDLVGTWSLVSLEERTEGGELSYPMGKQCSGILMYDAEGYMNAQLMAENRSPFAGNDIFGGTDTEVRSAINSYVAYYGRYELALGEGKVTHTVLGSLFPNWVGGTQVRSFSFVDDKLELSTPEIEARGKKIKLVLVWKRNNS